MPPEKHTSRGSANANSGEFRKLLSASNSSSNPTLVSMPDRGENSRSYWSAFTYPAVTLLGAACFACFWRPDFPSPSRIANTILGLATACASGALLGRHSSWSLQDRCQKLESELKRQQSADSIYHAFFEDSPVWFAICEIEKYDCLPGPDTDSEDTNSNASASADDLTEDYSEEDDRSTFALLFAGKRKSRQSPRSRRASRRNSPTSVALPAERGQAAPENDERIEYYDLRVISVATPAHRRFNHPMLDDRHKGQWLIRETGQSSWRTDRFARSIVRSKERKGFFEFRSNVPVRNCTRYADIMVVILIAGLYRSPCSGKIIIMEHLWKKEAIPWTLLLSDP